MAPPPEVSFAEVPTFPRMQRERGRTPLSPDFGERCEQTKTRESIGGVKVREAEKIAITEEPTPGTYQEGKALLRQEVVAASGRGDVVVPWLQLVDQAQTRMEQLSQSGPSMSLDSEFASALLRICVKDRNLRQQLARAQEAEELQGRLLKGRLALFLIGRYFRPAIGPGHIMADLESVRYTDDVALEVFLNTSLQMFGACACRLTTHH